MMKITALIFFGFAPSVLAKDKIKIIAIRHGQSVWNYVKNNSLQNKADPAGGIEPGKVWPSGNVLNMHTDSPLSPEGVDDAENLQRFFNDDSEAYACDFKARVARGEVAFAMSNLQRAQDTLMTGLGDVIDTKAAADCPIYIMNSLQECTKGSDAGTSRNSEQMKQRLSDKYQKHSHRYNFNYNGEWDGSSQGPSNIPMMDRKSTATARAKRSVDEFFELHDADEKIDTFVFAGHSHQIRALMKLLVPDYDGEGAWWANDSTVASGFRATKDKLDNGGAMEFEVERFRQEDEHGKLLESFVKIAPGSWKELDGFNRGLQNEQLMKAKPKDLKASLRKASSAHQLRVGDRKQPSTRDIHNTARKASAALDLPPPSPNSTQKGTGFMSYVKYACSWLSKLLFSCSRRRGSRVGGDSATNEAGTRGDHLSAPATMESNGRAPLLVAAKPSRLSGHSGHSRNRSVTFDADTK